MIMFTCNVCQHRQGRTFSKDAYELGVVLIRCEGCDNLHLIADNLGWFRDESVNIEQLMKEQGKKVFRYVSNEALEFISADKMPADSEETPVDEMIRDQHAGGCCHGNEGRDHGCEHEHGEGCKHEHKEPHHHHHDG